MPPLNHTTLVRTPVQHATGRILGFDVARGGGIRAPPDGVLVVVEEGRSHAPPCPISRITALNVAFSDAVTMLGSIPTPCSTWPEESWIST
jgi:hypothetical protein